MLQMKTIIECKEDFPILKQKINGNTLVYLDNGASTQKPQVVIDAITQYYEEENANVHRGIHELSQRATEAYEGARKKVAEFINAEFEEIIFTKGTTDGLNLLAHSLTKELKEGDEIILTEMEHHSNIVPWQIAAKEKGLVIKYIPVKENFRLDLEKAKEQITNKTKILAFTHVSNTLGTINPIKELITLAKEGKATTVIDGAQAIPHMKVDVKDLDCDFYVFSGHKMAGPTGVGILYGKKSKIQDLPPYQTGGGMIREVTLEGTSFAEIPERFEAGTPNIAQAIGLAKAIDYLKEISMDRIETYEKELTQYALTQFQTIPQLKVFGPQEAKERAAVFSFTIDGVHTHDVSDILNRYGIAVRAGHHCTQPLHKKFQKEGTTRASLYLYNTKEDIDKLITGIKKALEIFK